MFIASSLVRLSAARDAELMAGARDWQPSPACPFCKTALRVRRTKTSLALACPGCVYSVREEAAWPAPRGRA